MKEKQIKQLATKILDFETELNVHKILIDKLQKPFGRLSVISVKEGWKTQN